MKSEIRKFNYQKEGGPVEEREVFVMAETDTAIAGYDRNRVTLEDKETLDETKWARIQEVFKNHEIKDVMPTRGKKVDPATLTEEEREIKSFLVGWRQFRKDRMVD